MSLLKTVAQHVLDVHEGDNWTEVNIKDALEHVTYVQAREVTPVSPNSIAMLVHHLAFYNEVVLQRLLGTYPPIPPSNGFDAPILDNEAQWTALKEKLFESAEALAAGILQFSEDRLFEITAAGYNTPYKNLHGIAEHAHYHLGQIVILQNWHRIQKP
jgi:hypothetical protein